MHPYLYYLILPALLLLGYIAGAISEKRHYRAIKNRERAYRHLLAVTIKTPPYSDSDILSVKLVYGNSVIAIDYFKRFLAGIQKIFGGSLTAYEPLIDRARRESLLRMKEMAKNASMIVNVRTETSTIGNANIRNPTTCIESITYGTAIFLQK